MKKMFLFFTVLSCVFINFVFADNNKIDKVNFTNMRYSTQLSLGFAQGSASVKSMVDTNKKIISFLFANMETECFLQEAVRAAFKALVDKKNIKAYAVTQNKQDTQLDILLDENGLPEFVKWYQLDHGRSPFVLEFYTTEQLQNLACLTKKMGEFKTTTKPLAVVIDPGHGGAALGASYFGLNEKDINLAIALKIKVILEESGVPVFLTRASDCDVPLYERALLADKTNAKLFISIHSNASAKLDPTENGTETYYLKTCGLTSESMNGGFYGHKIADVQACNKILDEFVLTQAAASKELAEVIHNNLVKKLKQANSGLTDRGVKQAPFVVLRANTVPAVLLEIGFMSNTVESALLVSDEYQTLAASGIGQGVAELV